MATGGFFPPLIPPGDPENGGPPNRRDGIDTRRSFPEWGDANGDYGELQILRLEGVSKDLPKRPIEIRKSVESFLRTKIADARPENRGASYIIKMRNQVLIDKLKTMTKLSDGTEIKITEHPTLNQCRCVVYCPETTEYEIEDIKKELKEQKVIDVRRITRKEASKVIPTPTLILTINGTVAPQTIDFGWIRVRTRPYYPTPLLCYGCYEYGHPRKRCTVKPPVCGTCSVNHPFSPETPCTASAYCKHCSSNLHAVSSKKCPVYVKETEVQHLMVDQGIGYPAAKRLYDAAHRNKTTAALVIESNATHLKQLNTKLEQLLTENTKKDQAITLLQQEAAKRDKKIDALINAMKNKFKVIAEKDARIAELEAALFATSSLPPTPRTTATFTTPQTPTTNESKKETATSNISVNRRSLSRSPHRSNSQKRSKDGCRTDKNSSVERLPELTFCNTDTHPPFNKPVTGTTRSKNKTPNGETAAKKHKKSSTSPHHQTIQISDDEGNISLPIEEINMEFNVSTDDPENYDELEPSEFSS